MVQTPRISFFGLGAMGGGMAANLVKRGFHVTGFDVFKPLVDKLVAVGGHAATTPAAAASGTSVAVVMVATMYQANALLFDGDAPAISGLEPSAFLLLCSTCPPSYPPQLRERLDAAGRNDIRLIDCPVSGGTLRAADGTLSIFAAGQDPDIKAPDAATVLSAMSANLYHIPSGLSGGQKVKAIHQLLAAVNIITASEGMALAAAAGLDTQAVFDSASSPSSKAASFMLSNRGPHMLAADWTPLSATGIIRKDATIVVDAARAADGFPVPTVAAAEQLYNLAARKGDLLRADDAKLVALYGPASAVSACRGASKSAGTVAEGVTEDDVLALLRGVHAAGALEAMDFCKALGVDRKLMVEIVLKAAGWSAAFEEVIPLLLEGDEYTLLPGSIGEEIVGGLATVVQKAERMGFPAQMGTTALHQFRFARGRSA